MPFSVEEFFAVFSAYNQAVWPLQVLAYLAGLGCVALLVWTSRLATAVIGGVLGAMWLVNGIGYHWLFFAPINPAARLFAVVFVLEAILLAAAAFIWPTLRFRFGGSAASIFGAVCMFYAIALYPALGWLAGHRYPALPMFGIAPCPTTLFTIGVLLQAPWREVRWLVAIPVLWAGVGGTASFLLGVPQDYALFGALVGVVILTFGPWRRAKSA